jgi:hypothetical protein
MSRLYNDRVGRSPATSRRCGRDARTIPARPHLVRGGTVTVPWIKVDERYDEHRKFAEVGPLGVALWLAGLAYCNRNLTDGFIPWSTARTLVSWSFLSTGGHETQIFIALLPEPDQEAIPVEVEPDIVIGMLLTSGLWDVEARGYRVHDFHKYQPTKADIEAERAKKVAAGSAGGLAAARARATAPDLADGQRMPKQNRSPYPNTVPVELERELIARDGLPSLTPEAVRALEERSGQIWSQWGERQAGEYDRLVGTHGLEKVLAALDKVADGKRMTVRQLIWPALRILEPFAKVDTEQAAKKDRDAEADSTARRRAEQTQVQIHGYGQHDDGPEKHPLCPTCREQIA